jgi:protease-4
MADNISNETLEKLAKIHIKDIKSKKRWRSLSRLTLITIALCVIVPMLWSSSKDLSPHVALIKVDGIISSDSDANAERIIESLNSAYENKQTKAVIIEINSPGGSPVQSDDIYSHMKYLQRKHLDIPVYAVCTDICASGGYYIAAGAEEIYANKMTITGSIGVIGSGFGFTGLMEKIGVDRRTYTSGKNKGFLDPFAPQNAEQTQEFEKMLDETHDVFISVVETSRGDRLKDTSKDTTFSGLPFSGIEAKEIGLIDGFSSVEQLRREKLDNMKVVDYTKPLDFFTSISGKISNGVYYKALSESTINLK